MSAPVPPVPLAPPASPVWPAWQRVVFRFSFVYLLLQIAPWNWLGDIPGFGWVVRIHERVDGVMVEAANASLFHVRPVLVPQNGSGDTSYAWAELWLYVAIALVACVAWTVLDRRRLAYPRLLYWLRTVVRYWVATAALSYGIIKLFMLQMPFPTLSQLATPLGDFLPMRLSWMFIGYSKTYQIFSGLMETIAGLLLLRRNTITLGLIAAAGAFLNVVLINLSYDVPVKLYASHLLLGCAFLLALDAPRLLRLFVLNEAVPGTTAYEPHYTKPWHRWAAMGMKAVMIILILIMPAFTSWMRYRTLANEPEPRPFRRGVYDVRTFARNGDTVPALVSDSLRWRDVIFDNAIQGSVGSTDSAFWQRYRRGYFRYRADTVQHTIVVWKTSARLDSVPLFTMRYAIPDSGRIQLWTRVRNDSIYAELVRTNRHFQLAERQFHWLSEYNR